RTFLPVRAIADIAGFDVDFDGAENMVILTTEGVGAVAVQPTPAPTPTPTPAPTPAPQSNLAGTWNYLGTPFYILNADGTGMLSDLFELRWWSGNGIFSYCLTPIICGNNCFFPLEWYYTLNGNDLTLTNVLDSSETYRYVRR
ncbi:MAG: copper amine oxidase N-terminal domain-containing protein, partial [Defluviitaleaceae bacterium]|nr:copper amine oxidase N-terminal domain-containing protein [Defluviitaleaceae bacterium]